MTMPKLLSQLSSVRSPEYTVFGVYVCFPAVLLRVTISRASRAAAKGAETAAPYFWACSGHLPMWEESV